MTEWRRIDHVLLTIPPGAESKAREFYGTVLGLSEMPKPESLREHGGLWFRVGDDELHLGVEAGDDRSKRHPAFEVTDVEEMRAHLEAHDVETFDEPPIPGRERFSFRDPFGNRIELLAYC